MAILAETEVNRKETETELDYICCSIGVSIIMFSLFIKCCIIPKFYAFKSFAHTTVNFLLRPFSFKFLYNRISKSSPFCASYALEVILIFQNTGVH